MRATWPIALLVLLSGCAALSLKTRYNAYGVYGATPSPTSENSVPPSQIQVFMGTSPDGFTLRENELSVEDGYHHKILGYLKVVRDTGYCDVGETDKTTVIAALQNGASEVGGTAVIYAHSELSDDPDTREKCRPVLVGGDGVYGGGWVVVLAPDRAL